MSTASTSSCSARRPALRLGGADSAALAGLDVGSHSAKLVVRRGREGCVVRADSLPLPTDTLADAERLAIRLSDWLSGHGDRTVRELCLSLPAPMVDYEAVDMPPGDTAFHDDIALAAIANAEMQRLLGDDLSRASYDFWVGAEIAGSPARLQLVWTDGDFAARLVARLARSGWHCRTIDAAGPALARAAAANASPDRNQLAVDIGAKEVSFVWRRDTRADYVRSRIPFTPASSVQTLAACLGIRDAAAVEILAFAGIGPAGSCAGLETLIRTHLADWLESLRFEIERTLRFVHRNRMGIAPTSPADDEIVLCGGGACLRGLSDWLAERLRLPVRNRVYAIRLAMDGGAAVHAPICARRRTGPARRIAVKSTINLLPEASQRRLEHASQSRHWLVAGLAFAIVLAAVHFTIDVGRRQAANELAAAEESIAPLRLAEEEVERKRAAIAAIRRRNDNHEAIEQADVPLAILQTIGDCCHEIDCQVEIGSLRVDELAPESVGPGNGGLVGGSPNRPPPAPRKQALLAGIADDDACVAALVAKLHASHLFQRVEIEASQAHSEDANSRRAFQIRCQQ